MTKQLFERNGFGKISAATELDGKAWWKRGKLHLTATPHLMAKRWLHFAVCSFVKRETSFIIV